ncbi:hypothetical protein HRG_000527 [Hirsutella rhossiliensis]|uniref:SnoaL-like domain-containing protein n=1 Tax=Hirsutella rhossiliensis TaxID=111463 RepID=A0A9P8N6T9_9HYPO|nr:uncharacterized protein HRG_00527 [Hirsutella rhossiliensis]KAH0967885.1 hypothetical protein HRG_00527 [Hirsutella rhossiliensis]
MDSKRMQSARKFVEHYATHDNEMLHSLLADSLVFEISPSRSIDKLQAFDKAGFIEFKENMKRVMTGYPLNVIKYIESESSNMVVVWTTGRPQFREELKDYEEVTKEQWDYVGEFVFMLTMDETGEKITKVNEFIDSKATDLKLWPLVVRALGNLEKSKQASGA